MPRIHQPYPPLRACSMAGRMLPRIIPATCQFGEGAFTRSGLPKSQAKATFKPRSATSCTISTRPGRASSAGDFGFTDG
jgi:hypothetical protein